MFREALKESLIYQPTDSLKANTEYPSPLQLQGKVIVKHKKLDKGSSEVAVDMTRQVDDVSSSIHNGFLLVEDQFDHKWLKARRVARPAGLTLRSTTLC